jgi:hypothetical protein
VECFAKAAKQLLKEVEQELGWMYETTHTDGKTKGRVEFTVWSEVLRARIARARSTSLMKRLTRTAKELGTPSHAHIVVQI